MSTKASTNDDHPRLMHVCQQTLLHATTAKKQRKTMADPNNDTNAVIPVPPPPPRLRPLVGVGVVVVRPTDNKIYVGVRKGSHGATKWALPGGHLEWGESWADCAAREGAMKTTENAGHTQKPLYLSYRFLDSH
jgi:hypothetical protein